MHPGYQKKAVNVFRVERKSQYVYLLIPVAIMVFWFVALEKPLPWKIIDPSSPGYRVTDFRLTDYHRDSELLNALEYIFPVGTEKSIVDDVLRKAGAQIYLKASKNPINKDKTIYNYEYNNYFRQKFRDWMPVAGPPSWVPSHKFLIEYEKDLTVKKIMVITAV